MDEQPIYDTPLPVEVVEGDDAEYVASSTPEGVSAAEAAILAQFSDSLEAILCAQPMSMACTELGLPTNLDSIGAVPGFRQTTPGASKKILMKYVRIAWFQLV